MANVPDNARVVVIGAGNVGNSLVHHLARHRWRDRRLWQRRECKKGATGDTHRFDSLESPESVDVEMDASLTFGAGVRQTGDV